LFTSAILYVEVIIAVQNSNFILVETEVNPLDWQVYLHNENREWIGQNNLVYHAIFQDYADAFLFRHASDCGRELDICLKVPILLEITSLSLTCQCSFVVKHKIG